MKSLSSVGLGLSLVFGCLFLALVAELYYLLWWKKRALNPNRDTNIEDGYSSRETAARESFYKFCWKKPSSLRSAPLKLNPQNFCSSHETLVHEPQAQHHHGNSNKDSCPFGEDGVEEGSVEAELMRMHNFSGPPRFLFTINEETKEDLESHEDAKSRGDRSRKGSRSKSLSDLFHFVETTPYLTPVASPPYYTPPLTPVKSSHNSQHGFNIFFGSASEAEFNWLRSSPPPMFQFLKDAEDKLWRRKFSEEIDIPSSSSFIKDEENGSFITLVNKKNQEELLNIDQHDQSVFQFPSNTSQVLPLASSPPTFKLSSSNNNKFTVNQMLEQSQ
ncbi:hypothetical protein ACH5RR_019230 [Cinchona calisaya]|uniref:Membrane lipoprotein n=1 Tax=Cinchona calisaya TaxID=153742 RepID=A0ABD2ZQI7_9GENT